MRYLLGVTATVALLDAHGLLRPVAMLACSTYTAMVLLGALARRRR